MKFKSKRYYLYKIVREDGKVIGHSHPDFIHEFIAQDIKKVAGKGLNRNWSRDVVKGMNQDEVTDYEVYPEDYYVIPTYNVIKTKKYITRVALTKRN